MIHSHTIIHFQMHCSDTPYTFRYTFQIVNREFDRNIELISWRVQEWFLHVLKFPHVCDPLVSHVAAAAAAGMFLYQRK